MTEKKTANQTANADRAQRINDSAQKKTATQIQTQQRALQVERSAQAKNRSNSK